MLLQIKFDCNRPAGLGDIHVWKSGRTHRRTDARTPARVPSYKLILLAFGSGELKRRVQVDGFSVQNLGIVIFVEGTLKLFSSKDKRLSQQTMLSLYFKIQSNLLGNAHIRVPQKCYGWNKDISSTLRAKRARKHLHLFTVSIICWTKM